MTALNRIDPVEGARWEEVRWHDEVLWARDRQTRNFLALVCVHFDGSPFDPLASGRLATAVFEYRKRKWTATGKRLDEIRPDEAVGRNRRVRARRDRPSQRQSRGLIAASEGAGRSDGFHFTRGSWTGAWFAARCNSRARTRATGKSPATGARRSTSVHASASFGAISTGTMHTPC